MNGTEGIKLLDCTFRDGGYYTGWEFPENCFSLYLDAMYEVGVKFIEVGYRHHPGAEGFLGPHAFCSEQFLDRFECLARFNVAVMVDARDFLPPVDIPQQIKSRFAKSECSRVDLVRIATTIDKLDVTRDVCVALRDRGYSVIVNLMQAPALTENTLLKWQAVLAELPVQAIYLADSLGELDPAATSKLIAGFRSVFGGDVGFHAHNNRSLAVANSLAALDAGASYLDATITGMGRGAGNAQTEILACELNAGTFQKEPESMLRLISNHFEPMRAKHLWGPSLLYAFSAAKGIHPTYVNTMTSRLSYDEGKTFTTLSKIADTGNARSFSFGQLKQYSKEVIGAEAEGVGLEQGSGDNSERDWLSFASSANVVLVANGESLGRYADDVIEFAGRHGAQIYALNLPEQLEIQELAGIFYSDSLRLNAEFDRAQQAGVGRFFVAEPLSNKSVAIPTAHGLAGAEIHEISFREENEFRLEPGCLAIPASLSLALAMGALSLMGANTLYLAGFDGYSAGDDRKRQVEKVLAALTKVSGAPVCHAITPTTYAISQRTVFGTYD